MYITKQMTITNMVCDFQQKSYLNSQRINCKLSFIRNCICCLSVLKLLSESAGPYLVANSSLTKMCCTILFDVFIKLTHCKNNSSQRQSVMLRIAVKGVSISDVGQSRHPCVVNEIQGQLSRGIVASRNPVKPVPSRTKETDTYPALLNVDCAPVYTGRGSKRETLRISLNFSSASFQTAER